MRTLHYQHGERLAGAAESFGRIARSAPVDTAIPPFARVRGIDAGMARLPVVPSSYDLHVAARADRSRRIGEFIAGALRWVDARLDRFVEEHRRRALERATFNALNKLDTRTLRDLGLARSEIRFVALDVGRKATSASLAATRAQDFFRVF